MGCLRCCMEDMKGVVRGLAMQGAGEKGCAQINMYSGFYLSDEE